MQIELHKGLGAYVAVVGVARDRLRHGETTVRAVPIIPAINL